MKQIIQNYNSGEVKLIDSPVPLCTPGKVLVRNIASAVSVGTERSVVELGRKNLVEKAIARPDLIKRFFEKAKNEGLIKTFKEALERLDNPIPLGYSSAGIVIETGNSVHKFSPGDKVACIGHSFASHAEYVLVPENLCCKIPPHMDFEEASFGMLGAIALHGVRCARLTFGENVAVIGLGLLGLLTVQILKAYGCKVIANDINPVKIELARKLGINIPSGDFKKDCELVTDGVGVDAVIITVSTESDEPVNTAIEIARHGGKVVLVGVADIHPNRNEMWKKEVELVVSRATGPGSFDPFYEQKGIDYPPQYIRWTENRNLEEFLRLVSEKKINVKSLVSHRFEINDAEKVYNELLTNEDSSYIGVVFHYPQYEKINSDTILKREIILNDKKGKACDDVSLGVIGAGLFGKSVLLPKLKEISGIDFNTLSTQSGHNNYHIGKKYGFRKCTSDYTEILSDKEINSVVILTPHNLHAKMVIESLNANKNIFVEKPLCINIEELEEIKSLYTSLKSPPVLMVGYNRRFSPHAIKAAEFFSHRKDPLVINYKVNAGFISKDHWVHSEEQGGSRVVGEICHFVDFIQFLTKSEPMKVYAERISGNDKTSVNSDNLSIVFKFKDGSLGNIFYSASGDRSYPREQVEIFCEGKTVVLSDFKETAFYKNGGKTMFKTFAQEIGYKEELKHFINIVSGQESSFISFDELYLSTLCVFKINESLSKGESVII